MKLKKTFGGADSVKIKNIIYIDEIQHHQRGLDLVMDEVVA